MFDISLAFLHLDGTWAWNAIQHLSSELVPFIENPFMQHIQQLCDLKNHHSSLIEWLHFSIQRETFIHSSFFYVFIFWVDWKNRNGHIKKSLLRNPNQIFILAFWSSLMGFCVKSSSKSPIIAESNGWKGTFAGMVEKLFVGECNF